MLDERFARAFVKTRPSWLTSVFRPQTSVHVVLGRHLRPFSFWHCALLDAIGSPFAGHDKPFNLAALIVAADICTLRFPQSLGVGRSALGVRRFLLWIKRLFLFRRCVQSPGLFDRQLNNFSVYLQDYDSRPVYGTTENSRPCQNPWYLYTVTALLRADPRLTKAHAWDMPVGEGAWQHAANLEVAGERIDLLTPELEEAFRDVGAM